MYKQKGIKLQQNEQKQKGIQFLYNTKKKKDKREFITEKCSSTPTIPWLC